MGYKPKVAKEMDKKGLAGSGKMRTPVQKWVDEREVVKKKEPHKK